MPVITALLGRARISYWRVAVITALLGHARISSWGVSFLSQAPVGVSEEVGCFIFAKLGLPDGRSRINFILIFVLKHLLPDMFAFFNNIS